jgi:hypothetical protein
MFLRPPPIPSKQPWLWFAPYAAIGIFALAMLIVTALLQWREQDTARSALEGDMHWAERTIENRLHAHQDFLAELGRDQEFKPAGLRSLSGAGQPLRARQSGNRGHHLGEHRGQGRMGVTQRRQPPPSSASNWQRPAWSRCRKRCASCARIFAGLPDASQRPANDLIIPGSARQQPISAPSSPCSRWKPCCAQPCPAVFTARYSLSVVDADNREVFSNTGKAD